MSTRTLPRKVRSYAYLFFVLTLLAGMLAVPAGRVQATPPIGTGQTMEFISTATDVGSMYSVSSVAVGDMDGDGKLDIVSAGGNGDIMIWQNNGTPFADGWNSQLVGSHTGPVTSVAVGDLDGDGDLDIVSGGWDNNVNVWRNDTAILNMGQRQQKKARKEGVCAGGQREIKTMDLCGGLQMKREN
ncbi:MAG: VCBS repeat-containing protein, partial [Caldilineaceae bacterium]|nr:VCBS repeat-containing protein [Caldilineaceae bacterium]MBP8107124.1 VCBS repeat-containing protein [Caldilineaceae bacterium]MBP8121468.1 VCBS repeat-containing protein [Caldilineaceae bacterium]MBP9074066.1 VCBS repeat-containing protein [Caldilineaceae bacterium]